MTPTQLRQIMPRLPREKANAYVVPLVAAMSEFEITPPLRASAFLAQLAHESGQLRYFAEIWGPTEAQRRYEGRADLGNVQPGDGYRYRGRGPIQLTGRDNYRRFGALLGLPLEDDPDSASTPEIGFRIAGAYWSERGLNALADVRDFIRITKRINGGLNGLADRQRYYAAALKVFGVEATA